MKTALLKIGSERTRPHRDAGNGARCSEKSYWRKFNQVIGGEEVRFSPEVASIIRRLQQTEVD